MKTSVLLVTIITTTVCYGYRQNVQAYQTALRQPEAVSLFRKPLYPITFSAETMSMLDSNLAAAKANYDRDPADAENIIWLGRRIAYLWRYKDALDLFSKGIALFPNDARFYRHRGHRYITVREFDKAVKDLTKASELIRGKHDEVEPDGQPNKFNIATSTIQSNIWYHLGLAYYLKGDFEGALQAYLECIKVSTNPDMLCATTDWLYMTYRRLGRHEEATRVLVPITKDMKILENYAYHKRLLMYKNELPVDSLLNTKDASDLDIATQGYGVANWYLYNGQKEKATEILQKVIDGTYWAAFGFIAAEADLKRIME
ncbi:MAG: tetratricopeptide repeat protein [Ignavibacteriales bacterium]|nr:tetratricopeptide repeat protein [Ignavibacteriales bacterium]